MLLPALSHHYSVTTFLHTSPLYCSRSHNPHVLHFLQSRSRTRKMIEGHGIAVGLVGPRPARPYLSYATD